MQFIQQIRINYCSFRLKKAISRLNAQIAKNNRLDGVDSNGVRVRGRRFGRHVHYSRAITRRLRELRTKLKDKLMLLTEFQNVINSDASTEPFTQKKMVEFYVEIAKTIRETDKEVFDITREIITKDNRADRRKKLVEQRRLDPKTALCWIPNLYGSDHKLVDAWYFYIADELASRIDDIKPPRFTEEQLVLRDLRNTLFKLPDESEDFLRLGNACSRHAELSPGEKAYALQHFMAFTNDGLQEETILEFLNVLYIGEIEEQSSSSEDFDSVVVHVEDPIQNSASKLESILGEINATDTENPIYHCRTKSGGFCLQEDTSTWVFGVNYRASSFPAGAKQSDKILLCMFQQLKDKIPDLVDTTLDTDGHLGKFLDENLSDCCKQKLRHWQVMQRPLSGFGLFACKVADFFEGAMRHKRAHTPFSRTPHSPCSAIFK